MNRHLLKKLAYGTQQYVTLLSIVLWLGGFTFYAACVVRVGSFVVGGTEQGYVTQLVTNALQSIAVVMLCLVLVDICLYARTNLKAVTLLRIIGWLVMAVSTAILFVVHAQMDALLNVSTMESPEDSLFSPLHQRYQFVITFYWFASMFELGLLLHTHKRFALLSEDAANMGPIV
ncbi:MAG: hypothetical protein ACKVH8_14450 [Pirellulales bacterium]|jgi:hypothetical protein